MTTSITGSKGRGRRPRALDTSVLERAPEGLALNAPVSPNARYRYDTLSPTKQREARLKAHKQQEMQRVLAEQIALKQKRIDAVKAEEARLE